MTMPLTSASSQKASIEADILPIPCSCCGSGKKFDHFHHFFLEEPINIAPSDLTKFVRRIEAAEQEYLEIRRQNGDLAQIALLDLGNGPLAVVCTTQMVHILRCFYDNVGVYNQNVGRFVIIGGKDDNSCYNIGDTVPTDVVYN